MPCPTCDATMTPMGCKVTDRTFFWCPRCGTMKTCEDGPAVMPDLVHRCREFESVRLVVAAGDFRSWYRLGIAEAINVPANREAF
jgi:hypothetical protein